MTTERLKVYGDDVLIVIQFVYLEGKNVINIYMKTKHTCAPAHTHTQHICTHTHTHTHTHKFNLDYDKEIRLRNRITGSRFQIIKRYPD